MAHTDLILLDLDRTLLDTDRFAALLMHTAAALSGVDDTEMRIAWKSANVGHGRGHRFDLAAFAAHLHLSCDTLEQELLAHRPGPSLLYPDTHRLLAYLDARQADYAVLTFGETRMQALKLESAQALRGIPAHITAVAKRDYIHTTWPDRHGMLVDDKPGQRLPAGWTEVTLTRTRTDGLQPTSGGRFTVSSLDDVAPIVSRLAATGGADRSRRTNLTMPTPSRTTRVPVTGW